AGLITTEAGGTATFSVVLNNAPTYNVTIALNSSNTAEGVISASSLTFTPANWNAPQIVTVTGVDDAVNDNDIPYTIVIATAVSADVAYNGVDAPDVSAVNIDDESAAVSILPLNGYTTSEA